MNEMKIAPSNRWYKIEKKKLNQEEIKKLKEELSFSTGKNYVTDRPNPPIIMYREEKEYLLIPRYYGWQKFGSIEENMKMILKREDVVKKGFEEDRLSVFDGVLKAEYNQEEAFSAVMGELKRKNTAYLCLAPGSGKTTLALKICSELKKKTLVVLHKEDLIEQWKERINKFLPKARVGILQQKKVRCDDCEIVLAMIQSTVKKKYIELNQFDFVIFDESHHVGAKTFSQILPMVCCEYMLALSGTPKKGNHQVLAAWIGDISYQAKKKYLSQVFVYRFDTKYTGKEQYIHLRDNKKKLNRELMINDLTTNLERNAFMIPKLEYFIETYPERRMLFYTDRVNHLLYMEKEVQKIIEKLKLKYSPPSIENNNNNEKEIENCLIESQEEINRKQKYEKICKLYTSSFYAETSKNERKKILEETPLIFSTYDMFSEGIDVSTLSIAVFMSPTNDISQAANRVIRANSLFSPILIQFYEMFSFFQYWAFANFQYHKKENFIISTIPSENSSTKKDSIEDPTFNDFLQEEEEEESSGVEQEDESSVVKQEVESIVKQEVIIQNSVTSKQKKSFPFPLVIQNCSSSKKHSFPSSNNSSSSQKKPKPNPFLFRP